MPKMSRGHFGEALSTIMEGFLLSPSKIKVIVMPVEIKIITQLLENNFRRFLLKVVFFCQKCDGESWRHSFFAGFVPYH
jgi:hypothetical protein